MVNQDLRDKISKAGFENSIVYDGPSFDNSIIGVLSDGRTVYDYDKMLEEYVSDEMSLNESKKEEDYSEDDYYNLISEAEDFICYNTIRATPYMGTLAPVVISKDVEDETLVNELTSSGDFDGLKFDDLDFSFKV